MSWQNSPIYTDPHQFEPLLPSAARIEPLLTKAHDLSRLAAKQRLAVAHIKAEEALERLYQGAEGARALYTAEAVQDIHRELFDRIPPSDLFTPKNEPIVPGQLRTREVRLDPHVAPAFISAPLFLARWASFYGNVRRSGTGGIGRSPSAAELDSPLYRWQ